MLRWYLIETIVSKPRKSIKLNSPRHIAWRCWINRANQANVSCILKRWWRKSSNDAFRARSQILIKKGQRSESCTKQLSDSKKKTNQIYKPCTKNKFSTLAEGKHTSNKVARKSWSMWRRARGSVTSIIVFKITYVHNTWPICTKSYFHEEVATSIDDNCVTWFELNRFLEFLNSHA